MIFSLIFVAQTTFIGVLVTMMLKIKYQELFLMFAYGWIVGFLLMSLFIFIITIVIPLNFITSLSIICGQSYFIYLLLQKKFNIPKAFKINFSFPQTEQNPYFYIMFIVLTFFILMHYISSYSQFPDSVPSIAATLVDEEISIINSIIYGCNRFRFRIFLKDPQLLGSSYTGPSFPMLMMAMSMSVDTDYAVASCMYSYLNILATAIILWNYMSLNTHAPFLGVIIFFFNGGLAAIRPIFFKYRFEDDYITNVGRDVPLPWFQTLFYFLSYSKDAMFSIPAALAAMYIVSYRKKENPIKYRFAGALALLCPNPAVSATIFLLSSSFADCCPKVLPFALLLPIKFWGVKVSHFPIWREQQMNGHFCSQITSTFENYGLLPYGLLFSLLTYTSNLFLLRDFSYFSVWLITFFIRVGNSVSNNVMAQQAVILPYFAAVFSDWYSSLASEKDKSPFFRSLFKIYLALFLSGSIVCAYKMQSCHHIAYNYYAINAASWLKSETSSKELILTEPTLFNPVSLAGRQVVCGEFRSVWNRGGKISEAVPTLRTAESGGWFSLAERLGATWVVLPKYTQYSIENLQNFSSNREWTIYHR